jgi:hypothetical protein
MWAVVVLQLFGVLMMRWLNLCCLVFMITACSQSDLDNKQEDLLVAVNKVLSFQCRTAAMPILPTVPQLTPFEFKKIKIHEIHPSLKKLFGETWQLVGRVNSPAANVCYLRDTRGEVTYLYLGETFLSDLWEVSQLSVQGAVFQQKKTKEIKILKFY